MTMYILGTGISCSKTVGKKKKKFSAMFIGIVVVWCLGIAYCFPSEETPERSRRLRDKTDDAARHRHFGNHVSSQSNLGLGI